MPCYVFFMCTSRDVTFMWLSRGCVFHVYTTWYDLRLYVVLFIRMSSRMSFKSMTCGVSFVCMCHMGPLCVCHAVCPPYICVTWCAFHAFATYCVLHMVCPSCIWVVRPSPIVMWCVSYMCIHVICPTCVCHVVWISCVCNVLCTSLECCLVCVFRFYSSNVFIWCM